jgi:ABC-type Mn2+/Zn2+ transport system permease subunit
MMKTTIKIAGFLLVAALMLTPAYAQSAAAQSPSQPAQAASAQSVSGTIASVTDTSLTLTLSSAGGAATQSSSQASTVQFVIDSNTKIEGKPMAGASCTVEYTTDSNNRKVATRVTVGS